MTHYISIILVCDNGITFVNNALGTIIPRKFIQFLHLHTNILTHLHTYTLTHIHIYTYTLKGRPDTSRVYPGETNW